MYAGARDSNRKPPLASLKCATTTEIRREDNTLCQLDLKLAIVPGFCHLLFIKISIPKQINTNIFEGSNLPEEKGTVEKMHVFSSCCDVDRELSNIYSCGLQIEAVRCTCDT